MSKGSKRRPGSGYAEGYGRIWGKQHVVKDSLDHMRPIDRPEDITPDRLRFMQHSLRSTGHRHEVRTIGWVADLLEEQDSRIEPLQPFKEKILELEREVKKLRVWLSHDQLKAVERMEDVRRIRSKEEYS